MVEQAEILEHDADAAADVRQVAAGERGGVAAEHADQPARRLQRQKQQAQQRGLAGAGGASQKLERVWLYPEGEILQDFRSRTVSQTDILEADHSSDLFTGAG